MSEPLPGKKVALWPAFVAAAWVELTLLQVTFVVILVGTLLTGGATDPSGAPGFYAGLSLASQALFLGTALLMPVLSGRPVAQEIAWRPPRSRAFELVLVGLATFLAEIGLHGLSGAAGLGVAHDAPRLEQAVGSASPAMFAVFLVVVGVGEAAAQELFYRGFLLRRLRQRLGSPGGIFLGAAIYAVATLRLAHMPKMFLSGALLAWAALATDSVLTAVVAEGAANLLELAMARLWPELYFGGLPAGWAAGATLTGLALVAWLARRWRAPATESSAGTSTPDPRP